MFSIPLLFLSLIVPYQPESFARGDDDVVKLMEHPPLRIQAPVMVASMTAGLITAEGRGLALDGKKINFFLDAQWKIYQAPGVRVYPPSNLVLIVERQDAKDKAKFHPVHVWSKPAPDPLTHREAFMLQEVPGMYRVSVRITDQKTGKASAGSMRMISLENKD